MLETEMQDVMKHINELWPGEVSDLRLKLYVKTLFNIPGGFVIDALEELAAEDKMRPTPKKIYAIARQKLDSAKSYKPSDGHCRWCDGYQYAPVFVYILHSSLLEPGSDPEEGDLIPSPIPNVNLVNVEAVSRYPMADRRSDRVWCSHCQSQGQFFTPEFDAKTATKKYAGYFEPEPGMEDRISRMSFLTPPPVEPKISFTDYLAELPDEEREKFSLMFQIFAK